jgi:predicted signal transduction protein with EAL and GGDEF domain
MARPWPRGLGRVSRYSDCRQGKGHLGGSDGVEGSRARKDSAKGYRSDPTDTGTASLGRILARRRVDEVDQSFVSGLGRNAEDSAIVTGVVGMAQTLGLTAIAEGVETEEQLSALQTLGCDLAQGYLFGRPEPPDGFGELRDAALVSA